MNEQKHWDKIGAAYNSTIFDVFASDKKKRLAVYFKKHSNPSYTAIDFGCGTGKSFRYLAPIFKKVIGIDISGELLAIAKKSVYKNISFKRADLTRPVKVAQADFAFCCNVVMLPAPGLNEKMFLNIQRSLKKGRTAVFVLPAMESVLLSTKMLLDWYKKEGVKPTEVPEDELSYFKGKKLDILQGLVQIDGVVTKHYTERELHLLMQAAGFKITALERLEYAWDTEFDSPPKWMKDPYPWDWLMECKKL